MAFLRFVFAIAVVLIQLWLSESAAVLEFQDWQGLKEDLASTEYSMVDFFASWCPHCVTLTPKYEAAAATIAHGDLKDKIHLVKIQCDSEKGREICSTNKIEGFPTIYVYQKGKKFDEYMGGRSASDIVKYVEHIVKTGKPEFAGKQLNNQKVCLAKDFRKYVTQKS